MSTSKLLLQRGTLPQNAEYILKWATKKNVQLVDATHTQSIAEYLKLANESKPFAIINSNGLKNVGGWSDELVSGLPSSVKAICNFSAGYDNMGELSRFQKKGIVISNTPDGVAQATADTGLYLILGTLRNFGQLAINLREGKFLDGIPVADEYDGKTLGILGFGGIGSLLRDKVVGAFNFAKIQYHNRHRASPEREKDAVYVSFDELLATSDVIVIILPLSKNTYHIINRETLAKVKTGAIIVNIGRGPLIDEDALADALQSGKLSSVGLDVYEHEPKISPKLLECKNTLLLPHVGTHTVISRNKMLHELVQNLDSLLENGHLTTPIPESR